MKSILLLLAFMALAFADESDVQGQTDSFDEEDYYEYYYPYEDDWGETLSNEVWFSVDSKDSSCEGPIRQEEWNTEPSDYCYESGNEGLEECMCVAQDMEEATRGNFLGPRCTRCPGIAPGHQRFRRDNAGRVRGGGFWFSVDSKNSTCDASPPAEELRRGRPIFCRNGENEGEESCACMARDQDAVDSGDFKGPKCRVCRERKRNNNKPRRNNKRRDMFWFRIASADSVCEVPSDKAEIRQGRVDICADKANEGKEYCVCMAKDQTAVDDGDFRGPRCQVCKENRASGRQRSNRVREKFWFLVDSQASTCDPPSNADDIKQGRPDICDDEKNQGKELCLCMARSRDDAESGDFSGPKCKTCGGRRGRGLRVWFLAESPESCGTPTEEDLNLSRPSRKKACSDTENGEKVCICKARNKEEALNGRIERRPKCRGC